MRPVRIVRLASAALVLPLVAAAPSPFPAGYEASYQAYLKSLPPGGRSAAWLTRLNGVTAPPAPMPIGGKPTLYLFGCKNHFCDTDNVNIFLAPDRKSFRAVLKMRGSQMLLGGAGPSEVACVRKLEAAGGVLKAC
ncbi:hypothetical protein [Sphingomonas sp. LHG3443-2]|uniref:hypothetical protein n=1 Tax=Sphingomonas sp. LHG3443-2 TaxID=2804639 RepID=UPI003CE6FD9A